MIEKGFFYSFNFRHQARASHYRASAWMRRLYRDLDTKPCTHSRIFAQQAVRAGNYADTLTITITP